MSHQLLKRDTRYHINISHYHTYVIATAQKGDFLGHNSNFYFTFVCSSCFSKLFFYFSSEFQNIIELNGLTRLE